MELKSNTNQNIAIIFAGGTGRRMKHSDTPKQFIEVQGRPIIAYTLAHFQQHPDIDAIYIACLEGWTDALWTIVGNYGFSKVKRIVNGGQSSQASIYNALTAAREDYPAETIALIHDAVRPMISAALIDKIIDDARHHGSAVTCTAGNETVILSKDGATVESMPDRFFTYTAQAPQAFPLGGILAAHDEIQQVNSDYDGVVDSATLMRERGRDVHLVIWSYGNIKITYPVDVAFFTGYVLAQQE